MSDTSIFFDKTISVSDDLIQKIAIKHMGDLTAHTNNFKSMNEIISFDTSFSIKDKKGRNAINIFKYKSKKGWNIISGDNRFHPILAYGEGGEASLDTSFNRGLKYWIEDILMQIDFMDKNDIKQSENIKFQWAKYLEPVNTASNFKKEPIYTPTCPATNNIWASWNSSTNCWEGFTLLQWNQTSGFNYYMDEDNCDPNLSVYCNKYPSGCGPVAIGMIMHYYKKPNSFIFEGFDTAINYGAMPTQISPYNVICTAPTYEQKEISRFLKYVAGKYGHKICFLGSFVYMYPDDIIKTFGDWAYSNSGEKIDYYADPNHLRLIENLKLRKPVIFYGSSCDVCLWDAHYWICEGLHEYVDNLCSTYRWVYMNWGWGGTDNGWFILSSSYTTSNGITFDNANMKVILDITP